MLLLAMNTGTDTSSAVGSGAEELVFRLLLQIAVIIAVSRVVVLLARWVLGQTDVSGEILAGLLLGPSLLGALAPDLMSKLFHHTTAPIFTGMAQVGLVFLMFQIGLEFEFRDAARTGWRVIIAVAVASMVLPFALGYAAAPWFWHQMAEPRPPELGFRLFFATAMSITAIPILGRIFMELGLSHTRTAAITISAAAIDDVTGWLILGVISTIVAGNFLMASFAQSLLFLGLYAAVVLFIARPSLLRVVAWDRARSGTLSLPVISVIILVLLCSGLVSSMLVKSAIFGGFVLGLAMHTDRKFVDDWRLRMSPLVTTFLLPIFFAYTGLRTDIGLLGSAAAVWQCVFLCAIAFAGKFGGAYAAARFAGEPNRSALTIGVCMNTRALMELIVINIGFDMGVIPKEMFTMLVIMAIASTYMATPLIRVLMAKERRTATAPAAVPAAAG